MLSYVKGVGTFATFPIHIGVSNGAVISVFGFSKKTLKKEPASLENLLSLH